MNSLLFYTQIEAKRPIRATCDQVGRGSTRRRIHHHGERVDLDGADRLLENGFFGIRSMQQSGSYPHHLARSDSLLKKGFMIQLMLMRLFNFLLFSSLACWLIGSLAIVDRESNKTTPWVAAGQFVGSPSTNRSYV